MTTGESMGESREERSAEVNAAGGVVIRVAPDGSDAPEVLVVHRPRYDDWSFPKGKLDAGESFEEAALREVFEETALRCRMEDPLSPIRYRDARGRSKEVRYWLMAVESGSVESRRPDHEVDAGRWVSLSEAEALLTYLHDRRLLIESLQAWEAGRGSDDEG